MANPVVPDDNPEFEAQWLDQSRLDPFYQSDDEGPAPIWADSQYLRKLLEVRGTPNGYDRRILRNAVLRQLPSLGLYRQVQILRKAARTDASVSKTIGLYVLLFPGEAKDNTGIKDLNDKVLGYTLNTEWIALRQKAVTEIFWQKDQDPLPKWVTVGQDYKTAYIVPLQKTQKDFATDLIAFDAKLREYLLQILEKAEKTVKDRDKLAEIRKLKKTLEKDEKYRFDYLFGYTELKPSGSDKAINVVLRLTTEALKGAGIAKFAVKGDQLKTRDAADIARRKQIPKPGRGHDSRGQPFKLEIYLRVSLAAGEIKTLMAQPPAGAGSTKYNPVFVNTVWIVAFLFYRQRYFGHPDTVRDARKKALQDPKNNPAAQRELLELWLVTLNMLDFAAGFLNAEFAQDLVRYHDLLLAVFVELEDENASIDWDRLARALARDVRQTQDPRAIQGTTSEFQFYAYSSDFASQIFFIMDIRDLGVDVMAYYEIGNEIITAGKLGGDVLLEKTLRSGDAIIDRKRVTYDLVVAVFKSYFAQFGTAGVRPAAEKALGTTVQPPAMVSDFSKSIQVMLGGDEIFVAAHPDYAKFEPQILRDLNKMTYAGLPLNIRTGVAYSSAERAVGAGTTSGVADDQRENNQAAHDEAMKLAAESHGVLKPLERTHRRIELLIHRLETSSSSRKRGLAAGYTTKLLDLHLLELYARLKRGHSKRLSARAFNTLLKKLRDGDVKGAEDSGLFELVDFAGNHVPAEDLRKKAASLEDQVRTLVGGENAPGDPPPVSQIPARVKKVVDDYLDGKFPWR
jgi:hypothetical protein